MIARYLLLGCLLFLCCGLGRAASTDAESAVPLVIGNRTIHTFRASSGLFSPAERAEAARRRIDAAFTQNGDGWTSIHPTEQGIRVELDGQPLFFVLPGDGHGLAGETPEDIANQASRILQKAWAEARERRDTKANLDALLKVGLAALLLLALLTTMVKLSTKLHSLALNRLACWLRAHVETQVHRHLLMMVPSLIGRLVILLAWLIGMFQVFVFLTYSLNRFALTRPLGESLSHSIVSLGSEAITAVASSLPGIFIAVAIFLLAWAVTRVSIELFGSIETDSVEGTWLSAHTAPATRRIINALLWLFAIAMAYPYLPGSHTEAFKGLSVMVGLMVSIGASGVVGQIASGIILVYTFALKKGEYVRIQDHEGTVTELSLFVTRLRNGLGEEIAIPNTVVLGNVTRNFSRIQGRGDSPVYVLDTTVTIGYDTPWRQVHAILVDAAAATPEILDDPAPYVVQTALSDFYVAYKLVVHVGTGMPANRARVASDLHAAIQDAFNRHGVQIMSPHYIGDPQQPKLVPESGWQVPPGNQG